MGGKQAKQRNSLINRESYSSSDSSNKIVSVDFRRWKQWSADYLRSNKEYAWTLHAQAFLDMYETKKCLQFQHEMYHIEKSGMRFNLGDKEQEKTQYDFYLQEIISKGECTMHAQKDDQALSHNDACEAIRIECHEAREFAKKRRDANLSFHERFNSIISECLEYCPSGDLNLGELKSMIKQIIIVISRHLNSKQFVLRKLVKIFFEKYIRSKIEEIQSITIQADLQSKNYFNLLHNQEALKLKVERVLFDIKEFCYFISQLCMIIYNLDVIPLLESDEGQFKAVFQDLLFNYFMTYFMNLKTYKIIVDIVQKRFNLDVKIFQNSFNMLRELSLMELGVPAEFIPEEEILSVGAGELSRGSKKYQCFVQESVDDKMAAILNHESENNRIDAGLQTSNHLNPIVERDASSSEIKTDQLESNKGDMLFQGSIILLKEIDNYSSPLEKLDLIIRCLSLSLQELGIVQWNTTPESIIVVNTDNLLSLLIYLILKADSKQFISHAKMLERFTEFPPGSHLNRFMFLIQASVSQICKIPLCQRNLERGNQIVGSLLPQNLERYSKPK